MRRVASVTSVPVRSFRATAAKNSLAILAAIAAIAWGQAAWPAAAESPATKAAAGEAAGREIVERGTIESAQSRIVRCEVASPDSSGTAIEKIVPDGKVVQLGEVLVKLDSTIWEEEAKKQQIVVTEASAAARRARDELETAKLAKREYLEGTYVVQLKAIQNDIFVAESQVRRAEEDRKTLEQPGAQTVPPRQMEDVRFIEKKARNELDLAKTRLQTLQTLTKDKMMRQLASDLDAAEARLKIEEANLQFAQQRLTYIQGQVANCTIRATVAGTVVYPKGVTSPYGDVGLIGEGHNVRKGNTILYVADASQLQVQIRVGSSHRPLLKVGMKATVAVRKDSPVLAAAVASFGPESVSRLGVTDYEVVLTFDEPPLGLRIGQSAEVRIPVAGVAAAATAPPRSRVEVHWDQLFDLWDKNHDGRLEEGEVPPTFWEHLKRFDANGDGYIDRAEWKKMQESLPPARGR